MHKLLRLSLKHPALFSQENMVLSWRNFSIAVFEGITFFDLVPDSILVKITILSLATTHACIASVANLFVKNYFAGVIGGRNL